MPSRTDGVSTAPPLNAAGRTVTGAATNEAEGSA
jgi:hypothetical protein